MSLQGYFNRFDASKRYDELLFRASRGLQSAELNEIQAVLSDRMKQISDVLFRDGGVVRNASASIDPATGVSQLDAGAIYVQGAVREVAARTITIPTTGTVQIGVRVVTSTITEQDDVSLRDPAVGTRNFQEAGAGRTRRLVTWAWSGDGEPGDFFSVYSVLNGVLVTQDTPPALDGVRQLLARYDRDANGSYIVRGLNLTALGKDVSQSNYIFSAQDGVANVQGNKIDKPTATPLSYVIDPDLQQINNEPKNSSTSGTQTITLNRKPLNNILDVIITSEKTVTLTHGSFSGALDPLPDTSVLSIELVTQGGTTFVQGTDYVLTADQVDWSLPGNEPAPGSTYTVTYRFITSVTPTNINPDESTFEITDAVQGTLVLVSYRWKMPRYDVLALDSEGLFHRIKGVPSAFNPLTPPVSPSQLAIASYYLDWKSTSTPKVANDGTRVVSMREQRQLKDSIVELYSLAADERLQRDISSREPAAKYGVFTDPLLDDDLRDAGVAQDAVVVDQELQLAIAGTPVAVTQNNSVPQLLPFTEEVLVDQPLRTGFMKINPYQNFEPMPARVALNPAIDLWTVTQDNNSFSTQSFVYGSGRLSRTTTSTVTRLVAEARQPIEFLRQRSVDFTVSAFGPGENLEELRFDGINITPPSITADLIGTFAGSFTVPPGVTAGNKLVEFFGQGGSYGSAIYTGQGTLVIRNWNTTTTFTTQRWNPPPPPRRVHTDPLAQSFTMDADNAGRHISAIEIQFAVKGGSAPVQVQIRESNNGFPSTTVVAEAFIDAEQIVVGNNFVRAEFPYSVFLEGGEEYFIVLLTNDADHAVRVAELGKFDSVNQKWVTAQPYTVGVLLSSSNAVTWTAHQEKDLTFRLIAANFTQTERTINLGSLTVSGMTDLLVTAPVELTTDATSVFFRYTRSTGEVFTLSPGQALNFATSISDTMQIQAVLLGSARESPTLYPGVQSIIGALDTAGIYVSRQFQIGAGGGTLRVVFDASITGSAQVVPQYDNNGFQELTLASVTPIGDGFAEYVYQDTGLVNLTASKVKLNLTGTPAHRPAVRNIRAVMV
jgi:hypothetical protein